MKIDFMKGLQGSDKKLNLLISVSWAAVVSSIFVVLLIILAFVIFIVYKRKQRQTS